MGQIVISRVHVHGYGYRVVTKKGGLLVGFYNPLTHVFTGAMEFEGKKFVGLSKKAVRDYVNDMYALHQSRARRSLDLVKEGSDAK